MPNSTLDGSTAGHISAERKSPYRSDLIYPIGDGEADPFSHRDYVDSIETALEAIPDQFTLGLFGPWGSGKSTVLDEVARRTNRAEHAPLLARVRAAMRSSAGIRQAWRLLVGGERRDSVLVTFDAWRYEGDSLRREFIRSLAAQFKELETLPRRFNVDKAVEAFEVDVTRPREARPRWSWAAVLSGVFSAAIVAAVIGALYAVLAVVDPGDETRVRAEVALIGPLVAFILVVAGRFVSPVQVQESRRRLEFPEQFARAFRLLLDAVWAERVVVAIDNLDRCSPERVAEMLSTLKTFLEPALQAGRRTGAGSLCFIIAADDEALRRHLIAEEMAASTVAGRPLPSSGDTDGANSQISDEEERERLRAEEVAREAVDEYLRKFFNGSIRINDMLADDMREFTKTELADFVAWRDVGEDSERLVELVAQGLKGNPRRIKQFVNNLELRLQLFWDRQEAGRIQIEEPDVLIVAKLVILEEELPDAHMTLRGDPSLLERWHAEAEMETPNLPTKLVAFLRATNDIRTPDIAAYVRLKQTEHERTIAGYEEFIEMLEDASIADLAKGLREMSPAVVKQHEDAARAHFDELAKRESGGAAYGTARSIIELPQLHGEGNILVSHVLDRALTYPDLKKRVLTLRPDMLLSVGLSTLPVARAADLVDALFALARESDEGRLDEVATALAAVADDLGVEARERLKRQLGEEPLRDDVLPYVALAEAIPELVDPEAVRRSVDKILEPEDVSGSDPRLRVVVAVLPELAEGGEVANQLLVALRPQLNTQRKAGTEGYEQLAAAAGRVADLVTDEEMLASLAADIGDGWDEVAETAQRPSIELGLALCRASEEADADQGEALGAKVVDAQGDGQIEWVAEKAPLMPARFRSGFLERLREGVAGAFEDQDDCMQMASAVLETPDREELFSHAATEALEHRRYAAAEVLFAVLGESESTARSEELADRAKNEPGAFLDEGPEAVGLLVEVQEMVPPEKLMAVTTALVGAFKERRAQAPAIGPVLGKLKVNDAEKRNSLVAELIAFEGEVQNVNRREGILRAAYLMAGRPRSRARDAIEKRLDEISRSTPNGKTLAEKVWSG